MGTGYTRQSAASIVTSEVINAAPLNDEFNAIKDAFDGTTGHSHDGTVGEGPPISLTASVSGTLPIANGGTGATDAATAVTNLGAQPLDAGLTSISGLTTVANKTIYTTASDTYATTDLSPYGRTIISASDAASARTVLDIASIIGVDIQAYDAGLQSISGLTTSANKTIYTTGSDTYATTDLSPYGRNIISSADSTAARATLGAVIGTDVQAYDAGLQSIAGLTTSADRMIYTTASDTYSTTVITPYFRNLLSATSNSQLRDAIGAKAATSAPRGHIAGLNLQAGSSDPSNDILINIGSCASTNNLVSMTLNSPIEKRIDAAWTVGSGNGGLDIGSVSTDAVYHVYLISRSDTGVVDAIFSLSASAPTLPTNYTDYRRIGSVIRVSGVFRPFYQLGDRFLYQTEITDRDSTAAAGGAAVTMSVPTGIIVFPIFKQVQTQGTAGGIITSFADGVAGAIARETTVTVAAGEFDIKPIDGFFATNTSGQLAITVVIGSGTLSTNKTVTQGYIDRRGKDD